MKLIKWILFISAFSCIDIISQMTVYNSLYFEGGSWLEIPNFDSMKKSSNSNDFTLQFWVSGGETDTNEAPALFSLLDSKDSLKLALFRDKGENNIITTMINSSVIDDRKKISQLNWVQPDSFYLISILLSDTGTVKGYVNDSKFIEIELHFTTSKTPLCKMQYKLFVLQ